MNTMEDEWQQHIHNPFSLDSPPKTPRKHSKFSSTSSTTSVRDDSGGQRKTPLKKKKQQNNHEEEETMSHNERQQQQQQRRGSSRLIPNFGMRMPDIHHTNWWTSLGIW